MQARQMMLAIPMAAAILLSACGGSDGASAGASDRQASAQPIAVGEPHPNTPVDTGPFIKLAQKTQCAEAHNRLYVIDNKYVFHAVAGNCADASYSNTLYGSATDKPLCTQFDSIAGPQSKCTDEDAKKLFDVIVKDVDAENLGLDKSHEVKKVDFVVPQVQFTELSHISDSGVEENQNLVIKDAATFNTIWEKHMGERAPAPRIDFSRGIVLAAFSGSRPNGCYDVRIAAVTRKDGKILVAREDVKPGDADMCAFVMTSPAHLVLIEHTGEPIEFTTGEVLRELDARAFSGIQESRNVVIKDAATFATLWKQHAAHTELPAIDFDKEMVLAAFLGQAGGCNGVRIASVIDSDGKLNALRIETQPGPATACIAVVTTPAHFVALKRSDKPVEFTTRIAQTN